MVVGAFLPLHSLAHTLGKPKKKDGEVGRFEAREERLRANDGWSFWGEGAGISTFGAY